MTGEDWLLRAVHEVLQIRPQDVISGRGEPWAAAPELRPRTGGCHPLGLHGHPYSELCLALDGSAAMDIGGGRYRFAPPRLAVLDAGIEHSEGYLARNTAYTLMWIVPAPAGMLAFVAGYSRSGGWQVLHRFGMSARHGSAVVAALADQTLRRRPQWVELLRACLLAAFGDITLREVRQSLAGPETQGQRRDRHETTLQHLKAFLDSHWTENLTVPQLASMTRLSPNYLNRIFTQWSGQSLHRYLQRRRMEAAMELCRTSDLLIKEIAARVGYDDALYFSRCFRKYHGIWPTECRMGGTSQRQPKGSPDCQSGSPSTRRGV